MSRIIIVDDDPDVRSALVMVLEHDGHDCEMFASAKEALERQKNSPAEVIVLDQMMPGMTGVEACLELRARGDKTPVIFLSADREIARRAEGLENSKVIKKPFDMEELLVAVQDLKGTSMPGPKRSVGSSHDSVTR